MKKTNSIIEQAEPEVTNVTPITPETTVALDYTARDQYQADAVKQFTTAHSLDGQAKAEKKAGVQSLCLAILSEFTTTPNEQARYVYETQVKRLAVDALSGVPSGTDKVFSDDENKARNVAHVYISRALKAAMDESGVKYKTAKAQSEGATKKAATRAAQQPVIKIVSPMKDGEKADKGSETRHIGVITHNDTAFDIGAAMGRMYDQVEPHCTPSQLAAYTSAHGAFIATIRTIFPKTK